MDSLYLNDISGVSSNPNFSIDQNKKVQPKKGKSTKKNGAKNNGIADKPAPKLLKNNPYVPNCKPMEVSNSFGTSDSVHPKTTNPVDKPKEKRG